MIGKVAKCEHPTMWTCLIASAAECRRAVMWGKLMYRDDNASFWLYQDKLYVLPRMPRVRVKAHKAVDFPP